MVDDDVCYEPASQVDGAIIRTLISSRCPIRQLHAYMVCKTLTEGMSMGNTTSETIFFEQLEKNLPPVFSREEAARQMGGLIRAKTLSNLDATGEGPRVKIRIRKKVCYERRSFLQWLKQHVRQ